MRNIELMVGRVNGTSAVIPLTLAWANILREDKGLINLRSILASHGIQWDTVMWAQIEEDDAEEGPSILNLLDR